MPQSHRGMEFLEISCGQHRLLTDDNPGGDMMIINIQLAAYVVHLHLFAPKMAPLEHIHTLVDNAATEG